MDKKTGIIVGIISGVLLILLIAVFAMDAKVEEIPSNLLVTVNGNGYDVDEFKKYMAYKYFESGDQTVEFSEDNVSYMLNLFILDHMYYTKAIEKGVKLPEEEKDYGAEYNEKKDSLVKFGISLEDYEKLAKEQAIIDTFKGSFSNYYEVPQNTYNEVVEDYKSRDLYNTYSFRVMQIPYTVPEEASGDEAKGETVTTETTEETADNTQTTEVTESTEELTEEEKKDTSKETQMALAEEILGKLRAGEKSGETFEDFCKEYGTYRFTFVGNGYTLVNGDIEYATSPVVKSKIGNDDDIYNAFIALNPGEYTEIFDLPTYNSLQIVKMESKEEGFVGEGEKELKDLLLSEMMESLVTNDSTYSVNQSGYINVLY